MSRANAIQNAEQFRLLARSGSFNGQTAGQAPDYLQGNVVILPRAYAGQFLQFCLNNPKPCPLIGVSEPGDTGIPGLANNLDIRNDVPSYRVYRNGVLSAEQTSIETLWSNDLVTFVLGCSFTFEQALIKEGYPVRHIDENCNVPMYQTNIATIPAGIFKGPVVVTMRPYKAKDIPAIFDICARYPHAHGAPLAWGDPSLVGIANLQTPDYGDPVAVNDDEIPVYWACGVTPQAAIAASKPSLCITHAPGCMLVTDVRSTDKPSVDVSLEQLLK